MFPGVVLEERFVLEKRADGGGMGTVYRARDRVTGNAIAVKILRNHDSENALRFSQEARVLAGLTHPHVVRHLAHGTTEDGQPYLVMEWLEGESLSARLAREPLALSETLALAARVASALAEAHGRGVVHRDIKPSNIFLAGGRAEDVKLLDFGIAQSMSATQRLTITGVIMGTPGYMAPEQAQGDPRAVGPAADVFSLGAVLFECLTGRPAFEGSHVMSLLAQLLLGSMPRVRDVRPDVPAAVDALVARMLARDPAARPQDGAAVERAIAALGDVEERDGPAAAAPSEGITAGEMRVLSIAAVAPPAEPSGPASRPVQSSLGDRRAALSELGADVHELSDGSILLCWVGVTSPTDQAARAAQAALRLRASWPGARIALVTGRTRAEGRLPVGETVDRAARLLETAAASDGERTPIPVDENTRALLEVRFEVAATPEGPALSGEREVGTGARTLLGKPSHFVGRERELRHTRELVEDAFAERHAAAVLVTGAAGMGKSRLRHELVQVLRREVPDARIIEGRAGSLGAGAPLGILGSTVRGAAHIASGEPLDVRRRKIAALVEQHVPVRERARVAEFLGEMVGAPSPDDASPKLRSARQDPAIMAERIREAYLDLLAAEAGARPVLLVLEDLHWADAASIRLVDAALRHLHDRPFAVLAFARPDVHDAFPRLWEGRAVHEVRLQVLASRAAEALVRQALPSAGETEVKRLVERAAGNAFYLEELIRAVAEGRGAELPETVQGMVEARLLALETSARRLLRAASVFGEVFWASGVQALLGDEGRGGGSESLLASLAERELVTRRPESRFAAQAEYMFRHALLREGSYGMLPERDRESAHRAAGEWLLAAGEQDPRVLAEHFDRGGQPARAIGYYTRTAEQALIGVDHRAALALSDRALSLGASGAEAVELRSIQSQACWFLGDLGRAFDLTREVLSAAGPGTKSHIRAIPTALVTGIFLGRVLELAEPMEHALRAEPSEETGQVLCMALHSALSVHLAFSPRPVAEVYLRRVEAVAEALRSDVGVQGWLERCRADWAAAAERDPFAALVRSRESQACFEQAGDLRPLVFMGRWMGVYLFQLGAFEEAEETFERTLAAADSEPASALLCGMFRGAMHAHRGDLDRARSLLSRVREQAVSQRDANTAAWVELFLADVDLRSSTPAAAGQVLDAQGPVVLALPRQAVHYLTLLSRLRLAEGRPAEALAAAEDALSRGEVSGFRDPYSHAALMLVHAEARHALGRVPEARAAIGAARDDLLARAGRIDDPGYRQSFLARLPDHARTLALAEAWS